jgi:hypothetical protein
MVKIKRIFDDLMKIFNNSKFLNKPNTCYYQAAVDLDKYIQKDLSEICNYYN